MSNKSKDTAMSVLDEAMANGGLLWAVAEIERLRAALMDVVKATDVGAYFTARRAAGLAIGALTDGE